MAKEDRQGAVKHNEGPKARNDRSPLYFYNCTHDTSNTPCPRCFGDAEAVGDDWMKDYSPSAAPGISDSAS